MKKVFIALLTSFILWWAAALYFEEINIFGLWKTSEKVWIFSRDKMEMTDFWEVYEIIEKDYFTQDAVEKEDLVAWAISWMVEALWDRHSEFMSPEITKKFNSTLDGDFEWIGAVVEKVPLWVKVERILKGSPAKKYDVRGWDIIIKANGTELNELDIFDAVDVIKWPAGSKVNLTIIRAGEEEILEISLVRQKIHIPSIEQEYFKDENIAYIAINMFWDATAQEFIAALDDVKKSGVDGLIIDVRDNGGWYLQSAVQILSEFMPEKEVLVKTRYKNSFFDENYFSVNDGEIYSKNIVVLINENSASASEITAWALREYNKAILVGQETYGKWSVQQPFDMIDGSLLKLTVAKWFTPNGKNIDGEGIMPDIEIEFLEEDYENVYDRQLEEAKKILQIFIEKETIWLAIEAYKKQSTQ
jgi:carboxyl-terminal processing protease